MCGIAGVVDPDPDRAFARVGFLNAWQKHRGPDHRVIKHTGSFALGNTRLAIQDPGPEGNQPFVSADGRYLCVFNGEIYNHRELAGVFGLAPASDCDGAILPELWSTMGWYGLSLLRGMYAIAMADLSCGTLTLARDPLGVKPLYWRRLKDGTLSFASEPRPLATLGTRAPIRSDAIARYLHLGALRPEESCFESVEAISPNRFVTFGSTGEVLREGTISTEVDRLEALRCPGHPTGDTLARTFCESVDLHLHADVPTALLLSSGVDSGAVAAVAARRRRRLDCLTVAGLGPADETAGAKETAAHYGHPLTVVPANLDDGAITAFFAGMQRPSVDGLNTFLVCRAVREAGIKVALSGAGADEILGGYGHYRLLRALPFLRALDQLPTRAATTLRYFALLLSRRRRSNKVRRLVELGGPRQGWELSLLQREVFADHLVQSLTGVEFSQLVETLAEPGGDAGAEFASLAWAEVAFYLQRMLLPDADAFSMACSVELRVPFVDVPLFVSAAAAARRLGGRLDKSVFCQMLGDPFLVELARRPKRGFTVPVAHWMRHGPLHRVVERAGQASAPVWDWVDRRLGLPLLADLDQPRWVEPWCLASLNAWLGSVAEDPVVP